ncbi:MAG: rod shape-determining protein RodA [Planctomycetota bacterium]|nr:MAG: rod shape-determining protein RodA [Planctomycetota bacterium]
MLRDRFDGVVFGLALAASVVGIVFIWSASSTAGRDGFALRQVIWLAVAVAGYFGVVLFGGWRLRRAAVALFGVAVAALLAVLIFGEVVKGARRWIVVGPLRFQPSEFAKPVFVLLLAHLMALRKPQGVRGLVLPLGATALVAASVAAEPDLGTALVFLPVAGVVLFVCGLPRRWLLVGAALVAVAAPLGFGMLKPYQRQRLLAFLNPHKARLTEGYQILQSEVAVGSGGLWGKGLRCGVHNALNLLPERHTDFIFSVVAEEWGFAGSVLVLCLLFGLVFLGFRCAGVADNRFSAALGAGVATLMAVQTFVNVGMVTRMMPITGLPLPFVTYGGSALVSSWLCAGLLSVARACRREPLMDV